MLNSPIAALRALYLRGDADPLTMLDACLSRSSANASHNTYLSQDGDWSRKEAASLEPERIDEQPLWGIPVSLKDCFDLAGFHTSCGSTFYRDQNGIAAVDSTIASRLRRAGAVITGKTHLHQLAYGITGENENFGDCLQPGHADHLTGGSSSGAAASILEGSALAAIGTDTGGSIRVPAALCGLAGFRSSITRNTPELWAGGAHLSPTFDTIGWLYRSLADGPALGQALFDLPLATAPAFNTLRIGVINHAFNHDCETNVHGAIGAWRRVLSELGVKVEEFEIPVWGEAFDILAPIQASEAAAIHRGNFEHFEPAIADRLAWGASIRQQDIKNLRSRLETFREETKKLYDRFDFLLMPCTPMSALTAGEDQSGTRVRILRYTAPISLCGLPVVTLPGKVGGLQLVGPMNDDAALLALSAALTPVQECNLGRDEGWHQLRLLLRLHP
jgi:Asp-tRNA(Asn)/Glu-tRNA(Gln) amidotransferase A subunit family amidase